MARTDAVAADGWKRDSGEVFSTPENGAELIFIEALLSDQQLADAAREFKTRKPCWSPT